MRRSHQPLTLAFLDLDNFKQVNDTLGHRSGDWILQQVGEALKTQIRETDVAGRLGGDEFAMVLPDTDEFAARNVLEKIRLRLQAVSHAEGSAVSFSMGAVTCIVPPSSVDEMVKMADLMMYEVKNHGKGAIKYQRV